MSMLCHVYGIQHLFGFRPPCDVQGYALDKLIASRANRSDETERVVAQVHIWNDHAHLLQLVKQAMEQ